MVASISACRAWIPSAVLIVAASSARSICLKTSLQTQSEHAGPCAQTAHRIWDLSPSCRLTIFLLLGTIVVACMCASNYGKGLMPYVRSGKVSNNERPTTKLYDSNSSYQYAQQNYAGNGPYSTEMSDPYGGKNPRPLAPTSPERRSSSTAGCR